MFQIPSDLRPRSFNKDGSFTVTFPDFGYGVAQGSTLSEAEVMAVVLLACLMTDCMEKRPISQTRKNPRQEVQSHHASRTPGRQSESLRDTNAWNSRGRAGPGTKGRAIPRAG